MKTKTKQKKVSKAEQRALEVAAVKEKMHKDGTELFHNAAGTTYASCKISGHRETYAIESEQFERVLRHQFRRLYGVAMPPKVLKETIFEMNDEAEFDGVEREVYLRMAADETGLFIDLCNHDWQAIKITMHGWSVVSDPSVRFIRVKGMEALPTPIKSKNGLKHLDQCLSNLTADSKVLCKAFLLGCTHPWGPYPVLLLAGQYGTGKSTITTIVKNLIDKSQADTTKLPKSEDDMMIAASASWLQPFDNISGLSREMQDAFCRLATGAGYRKRMLYTTNKEWIIKVRRPVMLNTINDNLIDRPDLANRTLVIQGNFIPDHKRLAESSDLIGRPKVAGQEDKAVMSHFHKYKHAIMGTLCDAISTAIRNQDKVDVSSLSRMADFSKWVEAGESALMPAGSFIPAYNRSRAFLEMAALDAIPAYQPLLALIALRTPSANSPWTNNEYNGDVTSLWKLLNRFRDKDQTSDRDFPRNAQELRSQLNQLITPMRSLGVVITFGGRSTVNRRRLVKIERPEALEGLEGLKGQLL